MPQIKLGFRAILLAAFIAMLFPGFAFSAEKLAEATVYCSPDVYEDYLKFLDGRDPVSVTDYGSEYARRDVIEVVLLLQALHKGGYQLPVKIIPEQVAYPRMIDMVSRGEILGYCTTAFEHDLKDKQDELAISDVVIREDEFIVGLFVKADRLDEFSIKKREDVKNYLAVCNKNWQIDMMVLESIEAQCVDAARWDQMINLLKVERADFILAPFQSTEKGELVVDDETFLPLPGVKVKLGNNRHFIVSKKHGGYDDYHRALNKGITMLREEKLIKKAYTESGFFNPDVADWTLLNAD